jgi:serine/threonine protein kinase
VAIPSGRRIGPYEILDVIGSGGMGEVYRARDTRLNRNVALKVLPVSVRGDTERIARFTREAQTLAALNHPHIATIHGLEDQDGTAALALELVDGPTLAERIARGPVRVAEALSIARQVAEALEAAHDKGILHRDLKPSNIALTRDGRVKVLDFGLAKVLAPADPGEAATALHTRTGLVMGTPGYMSPEQARGEDVGRQSDIWSFGAVLYELLTGVAPFTRPNTAETLAAVLGDPPDFTRLPPQTPPAVQRLVQRCLEKDLRRRRQHIGDIRIEIEDALAAPGPGSSGEHVRQPAPRRWLLPLVAVLSAVAAGGGGWLAGRQSASVPSAGSVRLSLSFSEPPVRMPFGVRHLAISPDGSTVAFVAPGRLWIRRMDSAEAITVGLDSPTAPFFSPDGKWVGVMAGGVVKVPVGGGDPVAVAPTTQRPAGGAWRDDGTIVYATSAGLFTVSENGGSSKLLAAPRRDRKEIAYGWPEFVPGVTAFSSRSFAARRLTAPMSPRWTSTAARFAPSLLTAARRVTSMVS